MNIFLSRLQISYQIRIKARYFRSHLTKSDNDNNEEHKRCIYKEDRYVQMLSLSTRKTYVTTELRTLKTPVPDDIQLECFINRFYSFLL